MRPACAAIRPWRTPPRAASWSMARPPSWSRSCRRSTASRSTGSSPPLKATPEGRPGAQRARFTLWRPQGAIAPFAWFGFCYGAANDNEASAMTRLKTLLTALAALLALPALDARAQTKVTFGTDWLAEGEHGGFYQALATGLYK